MEPTDRSHPIRVRLPVSMRGGKRYFSPSFFGHVCHSRMSLTKRALYITKRVFYSTKIALYLTKRALCFLRKEPCILRERKPQEQSPAYYTHSLRTRMSHREGEKSLFSSLMETGSRTRKSLNDLFVNEYLTRQSLVTRTYTHTLTHTHTYIYICTYTYIHTCIYTYMYS